MMINIDDPMKFTSRDTWDRCKIALEESRLPKLKSTCEIINELI